MGKIDQDKVPAGRSCILWRGYIIPSDETNIVEKIGKLRKRTLGINRRVFDLTITVVKEL